jgi:hypothetical protein
MRSFFALLVVCLTVNAFAAQNGPTVTNNTSTVIQTALPTITFSSVGTVAAVQMTGTANWTYGSDQQTGTVTIQANSAGQNSMTLQFPSGSRVETQNQFADSLRQCTWSGADAVVHTSAVHHCWLDAIWFLPQITMQAGTGAADDVATVGQASAANLVRLHHERHIADVDSVQAGQFIAHLSAVDLDIDPTTGLPAIMFYAIHPDNDAGVDINAEVHYSAYQVFSGVTVPTRIQKFINHSLVLDLQITGVQVQLAAPSTTIPSPSAIQ